MLLEDLENFSKHPLPLLLLKVSNTVLLIPPALHEASQALFQGDLYRLGKALRIRPHALLDRDVAVEVQDVEASVLLSRHQAEAEIVDEHNCSLGPALDMSHHVM